MSKDFTNYANSFQAIARLRLEGIECLLAHLENPQSSMKFIHVAGTNGKGSVCAFLQCIFTDAGFKTGKYTSPNLVSVRERIAVDGEFISQSDLDEIMAQAESAAQKVRSSLGELPTQFEIWTAAAFLYFKKVNCDLVILETGLGGARDATNIIPPPLASVITGISLDHTEYLGNTIGEIALQKAGIIKKHTNAQGLTISAPQQKDALDVIKRVCREKDNRLIVTNPPTLKEFSNFHEVFDCHIEDGSTIFDVTSGICGSCQPENAAVAAQVASALGISAKHIRHGIAAAENRGRFEVIRHNPTVIYDGAHNSGGMQALISALSRYFPNWQGASFVVAFMADKDISGAMSALKASGLAEGSTFRAVSVKDNPRAASPEQICTVCAQCGISALPCRTLKEAYSSALTEGKPVILCGSLYLYKDLSEIEENALRL